MVMALVHGGKYAAESSGSMPRRWFARLMDRLQAWHRAGADLRYLAGLNDRDLKDLGLFRHDVDDDATFRDRLR
jgi:uncharacterized protein YjiS (DUF1127 family)